jgi:hypothetical protein
MRSISYRMLTGIIILVVLLFVIIIIVAGVLLMSTGNSPESEINGIYGVMLTVESFLTGVITTMAE